MSNQRPPSSRRDSGREYDYNTRRGSEETRSRSGSGRTSEQSRRPDANSRNRNTASRSGSTQAASRNPKGRPSARPPAKRPAKRRRRLPVLPILFLLALLVIIVLVFRSCQGNGIATNSLSLEFSPSSTLIVGTSGEVHVVGLPEDFSGSIQWISNDDSIVSISQQGVMKAKKAGESVIAAIMGKESVEATVIVIDMPENISSLTLNYPNGTAILSGTTLQLEAIITLDDESAATNIPVTWGSSNNAVASVNSDGLVTARDVGTATITAAVGNQSAACTISVQKNTDGMEIDTNAGYQPEIDPEYVDMGEGFVDPLEEPSAETGTTDSSSDNSGSSSAAATSLSLSQHLAYLDVGGNMTLGATVAPAGATVTWSSSNPSVATVSASGVVTGVSPGSVVITATAGGLSSDCSIEVQPGDSSGEGSDPPAPGHA